MAENEQKAQIQVRDLHKSFGSQKVLDGVGLEVRKGETVAVLGRSGTGKSVLLKLLIGLQPADSGTISIQGREVTGSRLEELNEIRKKIGFLFQQAALYESLTVEENVAFPLRRHTDLADAERKNRVRELLDQDPSLANRNSDYNSYYLGSGSPLKNAAAKGHIEIIKLLLERGADPNLPQEGIAPQGHAL